MDDPCYVLIHLQNFQGQYARDRNWELLINNQCYCKIYYILKQQEKKDESLTEKMKRFLDEKHTKIHKSLIEMF